MPRKYTRRKALRDAVSAIATGNEPWNAPDVVAREAVEHIMRLQRRNEVLQAQVSTMELFGRIVDRDRRDNACTPMAAQESIVRRLERLYEPVPEKKTVRKL